MIGLLRLLIASRLRLRGVELLLLLLLLLLWILLIIQLLWLIAILIVLFLRLWLRLLRFRRDSGIKLLSCVAQRIRHILHVVANLLIDCLLFL